MKIILAIIGCSFFISLNVFAGQTCSGKKILICHKEGKNSKDANEICVDISAVDGHLKNHELDIVGSCDQFDPALITTYACNAGLRYSVNSERQCVRHDQGEILAGDCGDSQNCTCSENPDSEADYLLNFMKYSTRAYDDTTLTYTDKTKISSNTNAFNQTSAVLGATVLKGESSLQFQLGSEKYGAEYFIDLCIRNENLNPSLYSLTVNGNILYAGGFFANQTYPQSAKLAHSLSIYCDDQEDGDFKLAQLPSYVQNEIPFYYGKRTFETEIPGNRFCVVRHSFREAQNTKLREFSAKKAIFQTLLNVDAASGQASIGKQINLCKVNETSKNTYACTAINFSDTSAFRNFILSNYGTGNSSAFQNDFKDVYNETCPNPCIPF